MILPEGREKLKELAYGFCISQCLYCVTVLRIADYLYDGPKTCEELADLTQADPGALRRILRLLAHRGIFAEDDHGRFLLTPLANYLRMDAEESFHSEIIHMLHPSSWGPWGQLLNSVKTGEAAFHKIFGMDVWEYRAQNAEISAIFDAMTAIMSQSEGKIVLQHLDLENCQEIVDVGGGKGSLIATILSHRKNLRGILFEQPHVLAGAEELLQAAGVEDRCRIIPGDFFSAIPKNGDIYLLKSILHNWNDQAAIAILQNCRKAMNSRSKIVLIESIINPQEPFRYIIDIHMLVIHGGRERTPAEFGALFDASDFRLQKIVTTTSGISLIEGIPV